MSEFINTIDALGDDVVIDSFINKTITEFKDNVLTTLNTSVFWYCYKLTTVDLPSVTHAYTNVFGYRCNSLTSVNLPELKTMGIQMFYGCPILPSIVLPKVESMSGRAFNCPVLTSIDTSKLKSFSSNPYNCKSLTRLILRNTETVCSINSATIFDATPIGTGTGYIYVPRALVDSYKAATNWSTYADQFRALEDYTVDGTTTGELDETKI